MPRKRTVDLIVQAPGHDGTIRNCTSMTEMACHTATLPEGHFAAMVFTNPLLNTGAIIFLDEDEVEAHIAFLRNAIEDAKRADAGLPMIHAAQNLKRN